MRDYVNKSAALDAAIRACDWNSARDLCKEMKKLMTIDERLEALTTNLELLQGMMHDSLARAEEHEKQMAAQMAAQDARERQARAALLAGIAAYLKALNNGEAGDGQ